MLIHQHGTSSDRIKRWNSIFSSRFINAVYGKVGYHDWEGLSVDKGERFRIAENLGENKVLIMRNHGLLTVGETAGESFMNMYYAVRMCEIAVQAQGSGLKLEGLQQKTLWEKSQKQYDAFSPGPNEWPALLRRCDVTDPIL